MCTSPNYMMYTGEVTKNDRPKFRFIGHHQYNQLLDFQMPFIQVPCGKCLECRIQHARDWADRCVIEAKQSPDNYFVTLTYDDGHLPERNSLKPKDLQDFMKRLRRRFPDTKIRFLACGEYGTTSFRPHYHLILFNLPLVDLSYDFILKDWMTGKMEHHLRPNCKGDAMFSQTIYEAWQYQGMIVVERFNYDTAAYVSQYVTKKCNPNNEKLYKELGIVPEFLRMSNRPGIGAQYFQDNDDIHSIGHLIVPNDGEAHVSSVPRYYDKLFIKKYGDDIFDRTVRKERLEKKTQRVDTYLHSRKSFDKDNVIRDYKVKKRHRLSGQL